MKLIYLAGPITGLTYGEATDWREAAKRQMPSWIGTLSPLRGMQFIEERSKDGVIVDSYEDHPFSSSKGINARDYYDCKRADAILVNFEGATKPSLGTTMEIAWGFAHGVPVVLVLPEGNVHDHAMIRESSSFIVRTLKEGLDIIIGLLSTDEQLQQLNFAKQQHELDQEWQRRMWEIEWQSMQLQGVDKKLGGDKWRQIDLEEAIDRERNAFSEEPRSISDYKKRAEAQYPLTPKETYHGTS
jgi:nucleoside 2-deoxyribosyltransferase